MSSRLHLIPALALGLLLAACGGPSDVLAGAPPVRGRATLFSLLAFEDARETVRAPEDAAPRIALLKPGRVGHPGEDFLPCLEVFPPATVAWDVPACQPEALLRYALAVKGNGFHGGEVTVRATLDGQPYFDHVLACAKDTPLPERRWREHDAPLPEGGRLEIHFDYDGPRENGPAVGLGLLRIGVPFEVPRTRPTEERPNVVLVVVDTLRAEGLSLHGNPRATSPHLDELAREGTWFENAYSAGPWTLPGTASILTGKASPHHGLGVTSSNHLPESLDTLPEVLQRSGVTTAAFTCNPLIAPGRNFDQGFEDFRNYAWAPSPEVMPDVLQWLDEHRDERFFLYLHLIDPHFPYEPSPDGLAAFDLETPKDYVRTDLRRFSLDWYDEGKPDREGALAINAWHQDAYDAEVWESDRAIGQLLERLEEHGLREDTVIAITSDHGEEFLEHGWVGHHNQLWDESVHVPLILNGPGVTAGVAVDFPVENRHVAPTLVSLAGVEASPGLFGPNLCDGDDRARLAEEPVFLLTTKGTWADFESRTRTELGQFYSVISDDHRLYDCPSARNDPDYERITRLYAYSSDRDGRHDLAADDPQRVEAMRILFRDWVEKGRASRPRMMPAEEQTRSILVGLGYVGEDD